jgi:hypothetical protein
LGKGKSKRVDGRQEELETAADVRLLSCPHANTLPTYLVRRLIVYAAANSNTATPPCPRQPQQRLHAARIPCFQPVTVTLHQTSWLDRDLAPLRCLLLAAAEARTALCGCKCPSFEAWARHGGADATREPRSLFGLSIAPYTAPELRLCFVRQ